MLVCVLNVCKDIFIAGRAGQEEDDAQSQMCICDDILCVWHNF